MKLSDFLSCGATTIENQCAAINRSVTSGGYTRWHMSARAANDFLHVVRRGKEERSYACHPVDGVLALFLAVDRELFPSNVLTRAGVERRKGICCQLSRH